MLITQIKSIFRNKSNIIYIIVFAILFTILNIFVNLRTIIDNYYDLKVEERLQSFLAYLDSEDNIEEITEKHKKSQRTVLINDAINLTDEDKEEIKKIKYVEDVETEIIMAGEHKIVLNKIIVDNWKHCTYIEKYFDQKGITSTAYEEAEIIQDYSTARNYSDIIKYTIIVISIIILVVCYKNILKNEKENIKLLKVIGYTKSETEIVSLTYLAILTIVGLAVGTIIFKLLFAIFSNILNTQINGNMIFSIITNTVIIILSLFIAIQTKLEKI